MNKNNNLSPLRECPFCGGEAKIETMTCFTKDTIAWQVKCSACGVRIPYSKLEEQAIAIWNKREQEGQFNVGDKVWVTQSVTYDNEEWEFATEATLKGFIVKDNHGKCEKTKLFKTEQQAKAILQGGDVE